MGRNVFVSYKYGDTMVPNLNKREVSINIFNDIISIPRATRVRDYVDQLQEILEKEDNINLGEKDGESLSEFKNSTIQTTLKNKIFRSSITIVMISKGMIDKWKHERVQWMPWEISYSLRNVVRSDKTSRSNAVLCLVLPDENNSYDWYFSFDPECNCTNHNTSLVFKIIRDNMFNKKQPDKTICKGNFVYSGDYSYIPNVKWHKFQESPNVYLDKAIEIRDKINLYDVHINMD